MTAKYLASGSARAAKSRKTKGRRSQEAQENPLLAGFNQVLVWAGELIRRCYASVRWFHEGMVDTQEIHLNRGFRECFIILWVTLGFFLLGALMTFEPMATTDVASVRANFAGKIGYATAASLFKLLGLLAFLIPLICVYHAVYFFRLGFIRIHPVMFLFRMMAVVLSTMALAALVHLHWPRELITHGWPGGQIGRLTADFLVDEVSVGGANLILISSLLISISWASRLSWGELFERVGAIAERLGMGVYKIFSGWIQRMTSAKGSAKQLPALPPAVQQTLLPAVLDMEPGNPDQVLEPAKDSVVKKVLGKALKAATIDESISPKGEFDPERAKSPKIAMKPKRKRSMFKPSGVLPGLSLLDPVDEETKQGYTHEDLTQLSSVLEVKLKDFGIQACVETVLPGPVVTRFEIQPAAGVKVSRITNLAKDLARSMAVISVRVVEVIPGRTTVGIEIPNRHREIIRYSEVLASQEFEKSSSPLSLALGKDISGKSVVANLAKMPHLLVAGTTGSGKSVGLNAMILSMLFKATPDDIRLIMIDPKMLELSVYDDIPHLLTPVVTDMKEASNSLRWCVAEMERRYRLMAALGVRNVLGYNKKVKAGLDTGEPLKDPLYRPMNDGLRPTDEPEKIPTLSPLPYIVVVIDEFADMIMIVGKKVEELIARIAQKARAAGIHLILATQRPSVDVITGLIKANVPSRIGFQVSSKVDSRTILDQGGAEQLLGHGDMLYLPPGTGLPVRVHGAFVSDDEVHRVCDDWRARGEPDYLEEILEGTHESSVSAGVTAESDDSESDPLYDEAVQFVTQTRKASISSVQRKLKIGYNRAARMIESMEAAGVVTSMSNNGSREVIAPPPVEA